MFFSRPNKYGAKRTNGYDSKGESIRANELSLLHAGNVIFDLKEQVPFDLVVNGFLVCTFRADFTYHIRGHDDVLVVEDFKGFYTPESKLKHKLFKALFPEHKLMLSKAKEVSGGKRQ